MLINRCLYLRVFKAGSSLLVHDKIPMWICMLFFSSKRLCNYSLDESWGGTSLNIWMKDSSWFVQENSSCLERDWHVPTQIWWCSPYYSMCVCKMRMLDTLGHMSATQLRWLYRSILTVISWSEVMEEPVNIREF